MVVDGFGALDTVEADGSIHDPYRIDYLRKHVIDMEEAVEDGVEPHRLHLVGTIDLGLGRTGEMRKRYGFIYVDKHDDGTGDLHRSRKDSFFYYQKVIASNGEEV